MSENSTQEKPLPTIWRVPDELWEIIEPILKEHDPPKSTGRPRIETSAKPWTQSHLQDEERLPVEPPSHRVPRRLKRASHLPEVDRAWRVGLDLGEAHIEECEELGGVDFEWRAADGAMGKARFGGTS